MITCFPAASHSAGVAPKRSIEREIPRFLRQNGGIRQPAGEPTVESVDSPLVRLRTRSAKEALRGRRAGLVESIVEAVDEAELGRVQGDTARVWKGQCASRSGL